MDQSTAVFVFYILSMIQAQDYPQFSGSDLSVLEGGQTSIGVESSNHQLEVIHTKIYATTINGYINSGTQCPINVADLIPDGADPAEESDLMETEFDITFNSSSRFTSFELVVANDNLSEKEEWMILYINTTSMRCAVPIIIIDDDVLCYNFTSLEAFVYENKTTSIWNEVIIAKYGTNEPDVRFSLQVTPGDLAILGQDYNLTQPDLEFSSDISNSTVPIIIYSDDVAEGPETFFICLPNLETTNSDVMLVRSIQPNCVTVHIIDNDNVTIGFKNISTAVREGTDSLLFCTAILSGNLRNDSELVQLEIAKTENDTCLSIEGSTSFDLYYLNTMYCFPIMTIDDMIRTGHCIAELTIVQSNLTTFEVFLSPDTLLITVLEDDVLTFLSQPMDVTSIIGGQAFFPCSYQETTVIPGWRIVYMNGMFADYTASTLPINHFFIGTGLLVTDIDQSLNLTVYSCFLNVNIAGSYQITSANGTLTILTPIKFEISGGEERKTEIALQEGAEEFIITIIRDIATNLTFSISLIVQPLQGNLKGDTNITFTGMPYTFYPDMDRRIIHISLGLLEDSIYEELEIFNISIVEPIEIVGDSNVLNPAVSGPPLQIIIYDNDYNIGFTNTSILIDEGDSESICISFILQNTKIHPTSQIRLFLNTTSNDKGDLLLSSNFLILNSTNFVECVRVAHKKQNSNCDGVRIYTIEATVLNITEDIHNIQIRPNYVVFVVNDEHTEDCVNSCELYSNTVIVLGLLFGSETIFIVILVVIVAQLCSKVHRLRSKSLKKINKSNSDLLMYTNKFHTEIQHNPSRVSTLETNISEMISSYHNAEDIKTPL